MLAQRLVRHAPPTATLDQLWQYVVAPWTGVPQGYIQSLFDSMVRRVAVEKSTMAATLTTDFVIIYTLQEAVILIV
ncbi:hypothetical protein TNCV_1970271 [Trichonephila clavipes]|uniref:Uncharacterized protein n=1 Tax=Trichonephila clavipes TaxID=2585209 RepID=A0A8X6W4X6_TRICX|nr:hypothetical protein TNCV_1970271 [Trichonephila clavipes]